MATEFQLSFCKICKNQKVSLKQGIICRLTNQPADFEPACNSFIEDKELLNRLNKIDIVSSENASTAKRFANLLLDGIFYYIFCAIIGALIGIVIVAFHLSSFRSLYLENAVIIKILAYFLMFIYYLVSESLTGRTLAKLITKTKVINDQGLTPSFKNVML